MTRLLEEEAFKRKRYVFSYNMCWLSFSQGVPCDRYIPINAHCQTPQVSVPVALSMSVLHVWLGLAS